jgi:hypothetical protein
MVILCNRTTPILVVRIIQPLIIGILHLIIIYDLIITIYFYIYKSLPKYDEFQTLFVLAVYSDDKILGLTSKLPIDVITFQTIERQVYAKYGMIIKESASRAFVHQPGTIFKDDSLEFLGSESHWSDVNDCYMPRPRTGKLCTSLCKSLVLDKTNLDAKQQFSKLLMIKSLLVEVDPKLNVAVDNFIKFMLNSYSELVNEFENLLDTFDIKTLDDPNVFDFLITGDE